MTTYKEAEKIAMKMANIEEDNYFYIKNSVLVFLVSKKRGEATELLVKEFLKNNKIYTTRDDEKSEIWVYNEGIYIPQGKTYIKEFCRNILDEAYNNHLCNEVISKIEADTYIEADTFFNQSNLEEIAVLNGILNIKTKTLCPFNPEKIFFNKIPVEYNPEKTCPNILQHFENVLKNAEDIPVIIELFGYLLYKEYKFERAFMFLGDGRNGKGKTLELMKRFIGIDNCSNIPLQQLENDLFSQGELFNKMANLSGDIDKKALKHTGVFKNLTGRDLLSAPRKFLPRVNFTNYAKMVFCANALPLTYDLTFAFFNRWILIDFPFTFLGKEEIEKIPEDEREFVKERNPDIIKLLTTPDELSGLLNLALEGLERILKKGDFSYSKNTEDIKMSWLRKSDSFNAFLLDVVEEDYDGRTSKKELRKRYNDYCKEFRLKPSNDATIKQLLYETFPINELRVENQWFWEGILLKPEIPKNKISKESNPFHTPSETKSLIYSMKRVASLTSQISADDIENSGLDKETIKKCIEDLENEDAKQGYI